MTPKVIDDEYSTIQSRQARYQARRRSSGLCITCGVHKLETKNHCRVCADKGGLSCKRWKDKQKENPNDQSDSV